MAKVTGPLFSVDARGKIADTLVFMGWRGIKTVRKWLKPANPRTAAQVQTREFFTNAVMAHHGLSVTDKAALRLAASGQPFSGFNLWVNWMKSTLDALKIWVTIKNVTGTAGAAGSGQITVAGSASANLPLRIKYGRTTALNDGEAADITPIANSFTRAITGLLPATIYYFKIELMTPNGSRGETGIYTFTSPAGA